MELQEKSTINRLTTDKFVELYSGSVKYKGLADKLNLFVEENQLLDESLWKNFVEQYRDNVDDFDDGWRCEYWGKMMRGGCMTYAYTKNKALYKVLENAIKDMLTTQDKLGRFSTYSVEHEFNGWDLWGRKYILLGFIYFYDICPKEGLKTKIIKAIMKHADYIIKRVGKGKNQKNITLCTSHWEGLNSCSILEPYMRLYNITGEQRYLDFAEYIISTGFTSSQNLIDLCLNKTKYPYEFNVTKAYEMMSCFQGLLEYYKVTKKEEHLKAVLNFANMVIETEITVIGGCGLTHELFDNSIAFQTKYNEMPQLETCVIVTWMNLCLQLLLFTGDSKWADYIELSSLNGMAGSVNTNKNKRAFHYDWEHNNVKTEIKTYGILMPFDSYSPLILKRRGVSTGGYKVMKNNTFYGCCACIGSAGTATGATYGVLEYEKGYVINAYEKAVMKLVSSSGQPFTVKIDGDLASGSGKFKFIFDIENGEELNFKFRIPSWSPKTIILFNGRDCGICEAGTYLEVSEFIEKNDVITVELDNRIKAFTQDGKVMLKKGPYLLARDERYNEDFESKVEIKVLPNGTVKAKAVKKGLFKALCEYEIPLKNGGVMTVCDYASAGKDWDRDDKNRVTVWF